MDSIYERRQELLRQRADLNARLRLIPYDGTPEIKEQSGKKYLYIRRRVGSRLTSTYVDVYSDLLYEKLLRDRKEAKELRRELRKLEKELAELGYSDTPLPPRVLLNLEFARANMKANIYDQAVLEGVATTFPQTEDIIENGRISGVTAGDVQKILNLKHAWEFILDPDVLTFETGYAILCHIAKLVNEGFYAEGGRIRGVPVVIGGCDYLPPLPIETVVIERLRDILSSGGEPVDIAIRLCLYCMKAQVFNDGNKRVAVIFACHYLISKGAGLLVIPEKEVPTFKKLLVAYYEGRDEEEIVSFLRERCYRQF